MMRDITVGELIGILKRYPPEKKVAVNYEDWGYANMEGVATNPHHNADYVYILHSSSGSPNGSKYKCSGCGKMFCGDDVFTVDNEMYCQDCVKGFSGESEGKAQ